MIENTGAHFLYGVGVYGFPFVLQIALIIIDEYCHHKRTLRRWERLGHPLDSLSFALPLFWTLLVPPGDVAREIFVGLTLFSCLFVTKDEWEHRELCSGFESWLHSLMFMLHPVLLIWSGWLWWTAADFAHNVIFIAAWGTLGYSIYQLTYWNLWRHDRQ